MATSQLTVDNAAVIAHINAMQSVIQRMADNSRSCKLWCVTLVAAILVLMANLGEGMYAWLAVVPILALVGLDVYYLTLEKGFRSTYDDFVDRLNRGALEPAELFVIKPGGSVPVHFWRSMRSTAVWPFYSALAVVNAAVGLFM